ncbi:PilN domain-containing protein [Piscirickettsia litoralis]|uniref:Fimbrial assembly protein n=1 Tax=Piscirickettsia litoralis TaxID=1891921 RepID=A0ABX3A639_9GAMM|nr:PilN domain-containing protein [Piscirickettsia litoralis]ODN43118.1 hypothetical protein BGC07_09605 [Piscirickettsia litoralis]
MKNINFLEVKQESVLSSSRFFHSYHFNCFLFLGVVVVCFLFKSEKYRQSIFYVNHKSSVDKKRYDLGLIRAKIKSAEEKLNQLKDLDDESFLSFMSLYEVYKVTPLNVYFNRVSYHDGLINFQGYALDKKSLDSLIKSIRSSKDFTINSINLINKSNIDSRSEFSLLAHWHVK